MPVTLKIEGLEKLERQFGNLPSRVQAGVKLMGPGVDYGLVWEWGSARIAKPGPKTTWGTNPDGKTAILTIQAPKGWIRVNRQEYMKIVKEEIMQAKFSQYPPAKWKVLAAEALYKAAIRCRALMEDTVPVDTGDLRGGLVAVNEPDPILEITETGALELNWL